MKSKIKILAFLTVLLAVTIVIPMARADNGNVTPVTTPFITIDPIGNHTIGDVFFVNGSTNLPVSDTLFILIDKYYSDPSGERSRFESNITINQGENGVNYWFCNTTPTLWVTQLGPHFATKSIADFMPDDFAVVVWSTKFNVSQFQRFTIFAAESNTNSTLSSPPTFSQPQKIRLSLNQTIAITSSTPTHATPLSLILSIAALTGIIQRHKKSQS